MTESEIQENKLFNLLWFLNMKRVRKQQSQFRVAVSSPLVNRPLFRAVESGILHNHGCYLRSLDRDSVAQVAIAHRCALVIDLFGIGWVELSRVSYKFGWSPFMMRQH